MTGATILTVVRSFDPSTRAGPREDLPMSWARAQFVIALLASSVLLAAADSTVATPPHHPVHKHAAKPEPVTPEPPPQPLAPLEPLTLEQMPATPPEVSYRDGELTIAAENSTLGDILRAVRTQTHAAVDVPSNATERVVSRFGPGPAREVLAELLNGSHFNYVLMGSAANPNSLERVILTPKLSSVPDGTAQLPGNSSPPNGFPLRSEDGSSGASAADMAEDSDDNDSDTPVVDPAAQAATPDQPQNNRPAIKTPEQLLQELQRQQQLQQQPASPADSAAPTPPQQH
jgi:hypothetical protein